MSTPVATARAKGRIRRWEPIGLGVRLLAWATRLVGLLTVLSVLFPMVRRHVRGPLAEWFDLPREATLAATVFTLAAGVGLILLGAGIAHRKRRAWQISVLFLVLLAVSHLVRHHGYLAATISLTLALALLLARGHFIALPDPVVGKWSAILLFFQLLCSGWALNMMLLTGNPQRLAAPYSWSDRALHAVSSLVGVSGPVVFRSVRLDDLTAGVGLVFGIGALLIGGYFLLRSAEPTPGLTPDDRSRVLGLLTEHGRRDSLGYFALRTDKSAVFSQSGKAAVSYRVLAGTALSSGDPLGDPEAWPGAIDAFLELCRRYAWVPAVLGCSERGATVWARYGLDAWEIGDEAVLDPAVFTLDGRLMRGVRQSVTKVRRAGFYVRVRRNRDLTEAERVAMATLASAWRRDSTERGFSMALSRFADPSDADAVIVTAERDGSTHGLLQFVPWGEDGLSLDLMRRDPQTGESGLNELMIADLVAACPDLGVQRVSLNFSMFRATLERGHRIGSGPVTRGWTKLLRWGSRWWQIESLYRFNAKFNPTWSPRFLIFPAVRELPRVALACLEAEGFGGRPSVLQRLLRRQFNRADQRRS